MKKLITVAVAIAAITGNALAAPIGSLFTGFTEIQTYKDNPRFPTYKVVVTKDDGKGPGTPYGLFAWDTGASTVLMNKPTFDRLGGGVYQGELKARIPSGESVVWKRYLMQNLILDGKCVLNNVVVTVSPNPEGLNLWGVQAINKHNGFAMHGKRLAVNECQAPITK